jgi:DNA-binding IclR family transcriptional regulator
MRVDVVERLPEHGVATGEAAEDASVKLALQNFQCAMQGDDSLFVSEYGGNSRVNRAGDGRGICRGNFSLSFKEKEFVRNRGLYFQLIQKLIELLKGAGSQEVLMARLCLVSAGKIESNPGVFSLGIELEAVGDNSDQAALRWGLGLAHLQQALLFALSQVTVAAGCGSPEPVVVQSPSPSYSKTTTTYRHQQPGPSAAELQRQADDSLAASVRSDFISLARPLLERLSEELHETVDLSTVKKDHLVFIDQVIGSQRLRAVSAVGDTFPLYCTANGKAYLAQLSDSAIEALIGRAYEARTPKSLTRLDALLNDLKAARRSGVAYDREEHTLGVCAVGVALHDPLGNAVAISVPVPSQRFGNRQALITERLIATKKTLEAHMNSAAA